MANGSSISRPSASADSIRAARARQIASRVVQPTQHAPHVRNPLHAAEPLEQRQRLSPKDRGLVVLAGHDGVEHDVVEGDARPPVVP